ncbi:MAG: 4Fe-4S dicluster domain-containing protein [Candidatus Thorarchaeota archaeon]
MKLGISDGDLDGNFSKLVCSMPRGENLFNCIQCGACSAICPSHKAGLNPFRVIRLASLGLVEELARDDSMWACCRCFLCLDVCPQCVQPAEVIALIRSLESRRSTPGKRHAEAIVRSVQRVGRLDEAPVAMSAIKRTPREILWFIRFALQLIRRKRIALPTQRPIPMVEQIKRIYEVAEDLE